MLGAASGLSQVGLASRCRAGCLSMVLLLEVRMWGLEEPGSLGALGRLQDGLGGFGSK